MEASGKTHHFNGGSSQVPMFRVLDALSMIDQEKIGYWDLFHCESRLCADKWDGHIPEEAANRLRNFLSLNIFER